ncbi:hypothetical protein TSOC_004862, partial [Tetrabaena socialis]
PAPLAGGAAADADVFRALAVAGTQCHAALHTELWGDVLVWGSTHRTRNAAECCAACQAHQHAAARGGLDKGANSTACNAWVFCPDAKRCGARHRECWLKHQASAVPPKEQPEGASAWTSGVLLQGDAWLQPYERLNTLTLQFELGPVAVELLPKLAPASVREIRRLAALVAGERCGGCRIYRPEPHFLVQGVMGDPGGYVATPRHPNPPQQKMMQRGLVCWAGGMGGPDFFVNLIDQSGFGDDHLCWGLIANMTLMDQIVVLPTKPKAKPNDMTFLAHELNFNLTLS